MDAYPYSGAEKGSVANFLRGREGTPKKNTNIAKGSGQENGGEDQREKGEI